MARGPALQLSTGRFGSSSRFAHTTGWKLLKDKVTSPQELLAAVESLYADEIQPHSRILKRRLVELVGRGGLRTVDIDSATLRAAVSSTPRLRVCAGHAGDWSAELLDRAETFVDVHDPHDPFSQELWCEFAAYIASMEDRADNRLPSSRYACARELQDRKLPFFAGLTLGRLCHIVQLAISQKNILGYLDGALVPYSLSRCLVKKQHAQFGFACAPSPHGALPFADWGMARMCLTQIMDAARRSEEGVERLANIKRIFQSLYYVELSETLLGHTKLSELLQDPRLSDLCSVELWARGYVVVPKGGGSDISPFSNMSLTLDIASDESEPLAGNDLPMPAPWQLSPSSLSKHGSIGSVVKNTFIDFMEESAACHVQKEGARRRASSLPKDMGSTKNEWETACHALSYQHQPVESKRARTITLEKHGYSLGLDVSRDGGALLVENVLPGVVDYWNASNPQDQIVPGDRIVEVNGISGDATQLLHACGGAETLVLSVQSPVQALRKNSVPCNSSATQQLTPTMGMYGCSVPISAPHPPDMQFFLANYY